MSSSRDSAATRTPLVQLPGPASAVRGIVHRAGSAPGAQNTRLWPAQSGTPIRQSQMQRLLEVPIHHVDHPVAESPKEEERADDGKSECHVLAVIRYEETFLAITHVLKNDNSLKAQRQRAARLRLAQLWSMADRDQSLTAEPDFHAGPPGGGAVVISIRHVFDRPPKRSLEQSENFRPCMADS
jgi:hypothetical protein